MKSLTVVMITARPEPEYNWWVDSLSRQWDFPKLIVVDALTQRGIQNWKHVNLTKVSPKPSVWQGIHRLTKQDWWATANARNTGICLCDTEWIGFVDDRLVLMPAWLHAVKDAMEGNYVVCGPYEKRTGMTVEGGVIKHGGIVTGEDTRLKYVNEHWTDPRHHLTNPYQCPGEWTYTASLALPLEWALAVNGFDETSDGSSGEDYIFGLMLQNNGFPIKYDTRMMVVEDRTPEKLGTPMIRRDKGVSPNDKSHALLNKLRGLKRSIHPWDIRAIRNEALKGKPFPIPTGPTVDWYDGQPLSEMMP
jgi:hypothetical protein